MKVKFSDKITHGRNSNGRRGNKGEFKFTLHNNPFVSLTLQGYTRKQATVKAAQLLDDAGPYHVHQVQ